MVNCTNHFLKRWVERIVGITTNQEANEYINKNRDTIIEHANKTLNYAEHIYTGQINDNITRNYHIKDDIVLITNTTNDALITTYKVDLGFTEELNSVVRKGLIEEVRKLSDEKESIDLQALNDIEDKKYEISSLEDRISILQEQVDNLKMEKAFKENEVRQMNKKSLNTELELKKHVLTLVNSKEYREDLQKMK